MPEKGYPGREKNQEKEGKGKRGRRTVKLWKLKNEFEKTSAATDIYIYK